MIAVDGGGRIVHWSEPAEYVFGYVGEDILGEHWNVIFPDDHVNDFAGLLSYSVRNVKARRKDGSYFFAEVYIFPLEIGDEHNFFVVVRDATECNRSKEEIKRLNLIIEAIRDINRLIVTEKDRERLLRRTCEVLVRRRGYKMAWIGFVEMESKTVRPVAKAGCEKCCFESIKVTWENAVKMGRPYVMRDIQHTPIDSSHEDDVGCGYVSLASVPIAYEGKIYGVLNVYSDQRDAFDDEEINLLKGLADDIGYAIRNIDIKKEKKAAMDKLAENLEHFDFLADKLRNPLAIIQGYLELKGELGEEKVYNEISRQVVRIRRILDELREKEKETYRLKLLYNGNREVKQGEN